MVKKGFLFFSLLLMAAACLDEPDCFSLNNNIVGISFKKLINSTADTVAFSRIETNDPALSFRGDTLSRIFLPLNYYQNETTFSFEMTDGRVEVLHLGYLSKAQFVSEACGERFVLSELGVIAHTFDSVRVLSRNPSTDGKGIQIEIFQ